MLGKRAKSGLKVESLEPRMLLAVDITVSPFDHQQTWIGGGAVTRSTPATSLTGTPEPAKSQALDWLFEDLNLPYMRNFSFRGEVTNDNNDPFDLDLSAMDIPYRAAEHELLMEAQARGVDVKLMPYSMSYPEFLQNPDGTFNGDAPNFFLELAEWFYANLAHIKTTYGMQVEMFDPFNEPNFNDDINFALATDIMEQTIPALRQMVDDNFATYGVEMPQVVGPSKPWYRVGGNLADRLEEQPPCRLG